MERTIHWGILGTGKIAEKFATALQYVSHAQLYAVGSRDKTTAENFARMHNIPVAYGSYNDLVNDPRIDVIYIATPHVFHAENTLLCLEAGKSVLCEKPFAMNAQQVELMINKAREKKLFLMEALWTRFLPTILRTEELIKSGTLGDIVYIQSDFGIKPPFDPQGRLFNKKLGGGSLLDIGIYPIFIALFLLGLPDDIVSTAHIGATGVDESMSVIFKYNKGTLANLSSTFKANTPTETVICGTMGSIKIHRMWHMPSYLTYIPIEGIPQEIHFNYLSNGYEYEAQEVTNCVLQGKTESDLLPLNFSLKLINLLDIIRKQWGLEYDE